MDTIDKSKKLRTKKEIGMSNKKMGEDSDNKSVICFKDKIRDKFLCSREKNCCCI